VPKRKLPYTEGDWIAVPLPQGGWAAGIIARVQAGHILLGYFFGVAFQQIPGVDEVSNFTPSQAILIRRFGDLGIRQQRWKIIGRSEVWDRQLWPMTAFVHYDLVNGRPYKREYSDRGGGIFVKETACDEMTAKPLPEDGLWGARALEIRLGKALSG
jgi:hypothetical protein